VELASYISLFTQWNKSARKVFSDLEYTYFPDILFMILHSTSALISFLAANRKFLYYVEASGVFSPFILLNIKHINLFK
jgi:hypothetical protein